MSEFSYSVRATVDKELPAVSSGDYDIDFCSGNNATQTPPRLQIALSAFGTSSVSGVVAECFTATTNAVTMLSPSTFGTATNAYIFLQESSGATASSAVISSANTTEAGSSSFAKLSLGAAALVPVKPDNSYSVKSDSTAATCSVQVLVIGE